MSLKERVSQIEDARAEAAISPEDSDPKIRAGVEANVRNAKKAVIELESAYKDEVIAASAVIAIEGPGSKEFADVARLVFETPTVDYDLVVTRMVDSVKSRSGRLEFSTQEFFLVLDELSRLKTEYDILSFPVPRVNAAIDPVYGRPTEEAIKSLLKINYDEQLTSIITRREIGKLALAMKFAGKNLPVVVYNYHGSLDEQYLPRPIVTVSVKSEEVTKDFVKEVLTQVKNRLSGTVSGKAPSRSKKATAAVATTTEEQK